MTVRVENIVREFERLPEPEQRELADEILRRAQHWESPPLTDDELTCAADALFSDMDRREAQYEKSAPG